MADVLFVVLILALFGLAWLLVQACDRIIGAEEVTEITVVPDEASAHDEVMA
jgi:hypothetical protein